MASKVVISEAMNTLSKGIKVSKKLNEAPYQKKFKKAINESIELTPEEKEFIKDRLSIELEWDSDEPNMDKVKVYQPEQRQLMKNIIAKLDNNEVREEMSPEDKTDSDVIRDVARKSWDRRNAKISKAEQDVLNKHSLVRDSDSYTHGTILKDLGNGKRRVLTGNQINRDNPHMDSDKMNYADRARKIDKRDYAKDVNHSFNGKNFGEKERNRQSWNMSRNVRDMENALMDRKYAKDVLARKDDPEEYYNREITKAQKSLDTAKNNKEHNVEWNERRLKGSQDTIDALLKKK